MSLVRQRYQFIKQFKCHTICPGHLSASQTLIRYYWHCHSTHQTCLRQLTAGHQPTAEMQESRTILITMMRIFNKIIVGLSGAKTFSIWHVSQVWWHFNSLVKFGRCWLQILVTIVKRTTAPQQQQQQQQELTKEFVRKSCCVWVELINGNVLLVAHHQYFLNCSHVTISHLT